MNEVARRHNFRILLHEKPFAGINGSGKHNNWSLGTDTGKLLFSPGKTPRENLEFIVFVSNVMAAVHKHNALLKASIMTATNAHRLGANEAPPAIISMFLGTQLNELLDRIEKNDADALILQGKGELRLDVNQIPELMIDNTDRNRTSPFAFTGNRFEYRAVGSSANCSSALIALNAAVAVELNEFADRVEARIANGESVEKVLLDEARENIIKSRSIQFDGNGYSDEWKEEARRRGLDVEASAPLMFDSYLWPSSVEMFEKAGLFNKKELEARNEVKWEMYSKKLQIESRVLGDLAINHIIPAAITYQRLLLDNVYKVKELFDGDTAKKIGGQDMVSIEKIAGHLNDIKFLVEKMIKERHGANRKPTERDKAIAYHDAVAPLMEEIRKHIDALELMVDNEIWPLPKYRELLFIR